MCCAIFHYCPHMRSIILHRAKYYPITLSVLMQIDYNKMLKHILPTIISIENLYYCTILYNNLEFYILNILMEILKFIKHIAPSFNFVPRDQLYCAKQIISQ